MMIDLPARGYRGRVYLGSFLRYRPLWLKYEGSKTLTDFQVGFILTNHDIAFEKLRPDKRDLLFITQDGEAIPYWMEKADSSEIIVWLKFSTIKKGKEIFWLYYGNGNFTGASNGSSTFEFFDDFSANLDNWEQVGDGSAQIVEDSDAYNGFSCKISPGTSGERTLWIPKIFEGDFAVELRLKGNQYIRVFMRGQDKTVKRNAVADFHSNDTDHYNAIYDYIDDVSLANGGAGDIDWTIYHRESMRASGLNYYWYLDGSLYIQGTDSGGSQPTSGYIGINSQGGDAFFDFVAVRKYVQVEPVIVLR